MPEKLSDLSVQIKEACKLSGARWAIYLRRIERSWELSSTGFLNRIQRATILDIIQRPDVTAWLAGALSSGRVRSRQAGILTQKLGCSRIYAFPDASQKALILVGAELIEKSAQGYFRILSLAKPQSDFDSYHLPKVDQEPLEGRETYSSADPQLIVLVVDDEPGNLRLCQRQLEGAGFEAITTSSPSQALAALARQPVDLLVVDIRVPEMDGFQLMTMARRLHPDLAVAIMTGYGTVETAIEVLHRGADGLILKPFMGPDFLQGVHGAMEVNQRKREISRMLTLRTLLDLTEALFAETDLKKLQSLILDSVCDNLHCEIAILYKKKTVEQPLMLVEQRGDLESAIITRLELELVLPADSGLKAVWASRDGSSDGRHIVLQPLLTELGLESVICVPVTYKDRGHGIQGSQVFLIARKCNQPSFQEGDYEMFVILVRQASLALENAGLYAELWSYVTQLEKSQRALIQAEKMATAGRLTASIAHEINNPLQSVQNCLHLVSRGVLIGQEKQNYLELAQGELDRLMSTVQRMLDLYRPGVRDRQAVNVDDLVGRVLLLVEQQLKEHNIIVQTFLGAKSAEVMVVRSQIQQVLLNLVLNAMEAMPGGGHIYIETARKNDKVEILVADDGPGIPMTVHEHLFEPFTSMKENGTGLGLAVSYGIITAHGGSFEMIPDRWKGACFQIVLPIGEKS
jgi:two-component system, NtrC family, sensor kinase